MSKAYEVITNKIIAMLEAGVVPWRATWSGASPVSIHGHTYRGINRMMLAMVQTLEGYRSNVWLTFNQAKQRGGSVKRGAKGTPVVLYRFVPVEGANGAKVDANGEPITRMIVSYYTVFNLDQTEGVECPAKLAATERVASPIESCERILAGFNGPTVSHGGTRAYYRPSTDSVQLPEPSRFESQEAYYATAFHELVHSTGHESRLAREAVTNPSGFGSHEYSKEELVAELGAAYLCAEAGIEPATIENSAAYLANWLGALRSDARMIISAASQAQKAADLILGRSATHESVSEAA